MTMSSLRALGWTDHRESQFERFHERGLVPGRVVSDLGSAWRIAHAGGETVASLAGELRRAGSPERPVVGDWVALRREPDGAGRIEGRLARHGRFARQAAGERTREQVAAANVDVLVIVMGLDGDFNPRRLERALLLAWEGGAQPLVLLNKSDACAQTEARVREIEAVAGGVPVLAVSARSGHGLDALAPWLVPGRTLALIGSSGVGKSTLLNRLLGEDRQATLPVRDSDDRGRHATTRRELFRLPGGALVVDTPGMRELQLWAGEDALPTAFADLEALATQCGFRDCTHDGEPRCAVAAAVADGRLSARRLAAYHKLAAELHHAAVRRDGAARVEERRRWRAIHRSMRRHPKAGRGR